MNRQIAISPQGRIVLATPPATSLNPSGDDSPDPLPTAVLEAFSADQSLGLIYLATGGLTLEVSETLDWLRRFSKLFFTYLCSLPNLDDLLKSKLQVAPAYELLSQDLEDLRLQAPPMVGGEYLTVEILEQWWIQLFDELVRQLRNTTESIQEYLHSLCPPGQQSWSVMGRVCFHLAENKQNPHQPFAFLATYAHKVSSQGKAQHLPLSQALEQYGGAKSGASQKILQNLLKPVQSASTQSALMKELLTSGDLFHPLAWSATEALRFLKEVPLLESAGIVVRVPNWWRAKNPPHPEVQITIGGKKPKGLGLDSLLSFDINLSLGGEPLTEKEWRDLLQSSDGLVSLRGQWVEIDRQQLKEVLDHWQKVQKTVAQDGLTFAEAMRLLAGTGPLSGRLPHPSSANSPQGSTPSWSKVVAGGWLEKTLEQLRTPQDSGSASAANTLLKKTTFKATLRPYQSKGLEWLWLLYQLRLGSCLADDMGLGKTIQILALLNLKKITNKTTKQKTPQSQALLVLPASLMNNWMDEAKRFAPDLHVLPAHPSFRSTSPLTMDSADLVLTTYGYLAKTPLFAERTWDILILDEAQAIKNPNTKQTQAVKELRANHRIALTGTPIENHLADLWSLFDFLCPGLLGSSKGFSDFIKTTDNPYPALRRLVQPYILRRLKTDRTVIADLPDKTELKTYCSLSKHQGVLYQKAVEKLVEKLKTADGISRRGVILASLMQLKQICNHPAHHLGSGAYDPVASGKFARLAELCEMIAERQEKLLVFTQFRELTEPLAAYLAKIFNREGLVLSGETAIKQRKKLVDTFQKDDGPPFFVLSLKAGGTGLNLTAASHVIHFDRWWNPAVENQATDRAFRIGQKRSVLVHKFICRGTIEEKIDAMIDQKKQVASDILGNSQGEVSLTDLSNKELIELVSLDMNTAISL